MLNPALERTLHSRETASDELFEIIDGEIVRKTTSAYSGWIWSKLAGRIGEHLRRSGLGRTYVQALFVLTELTALRPDLAIVSNGTWPIDKPPPSDREWEIVPDVAIEVVSPNCSRSTLVPKLHAYFAAGVIEVWVIEPEFRIARVSRGIDQVRTVVADQELTSELLPGWSMNVGDLLPHVFTENKTPD